MEENQRMRTEVHYTQWPNWVMLKTCLVEDIDTSNGSDASWEWTIDDKWIRLDE